MLRKKSEQYAVEEIITSKHYSSAELKKIIQDLYQDLKEKESQLEAVLGIVSEAVTMIDSEDTVVAWSKQAMEMYDIEPEAIIGKNIKSFFSSLVVTEVLKDGEVSDSYHKPCPGKHVLINASPIRLDGKVIGSVGAERDITEKVYLHQELSKVNSQVQLLEKKIIESDLKKDFLPFLQEVASLEEQGELPDANSNLNELTSLAEKQLIIDTLKKVGGNKSKAARLLGIPRSTLYYKLKILGLT